MADRLLLTIAHPSQGHWLGNCCNPLVILVGILGGLAQKMWFFQMALISFLSVLTCSSRCQYDILKVWLKKIDQNPPVGYVKVAVGDLWWEKLLDFTGFPVVWCPWWLNDWFFTFWVFRSIQIDLKMIFWKCYLKKTMFTYHLVPNSSQIGLNFGKLG